MLWKWISIIWAMSRAGFGELLALPTSFLNLSIMPLVAEEAWRKDSQELEILVSKIQKQLAPSAEIIHDAETSRTQEQTRSSDRCSVCHKIGQYQMLIVLDCKDYAKPVDVKGVEEFHGLLDDVGAHKGALICPKGFTAAANIRAKDWHIYSSTTG